MASDPPFPVPGDAGEPPAVADTPKSNEPGDQRPGETKREKANRYQRELRARRKAEGRPIQGGNPGKAKPVPSKTPERRALAEEAAQGVSDVITEVGIVLTPITPLGGAYLIASAEESQRVAATLAEVEPRVMGTLLKMRRVTAWGAVVSLGAGFVGAVMLERGIAPPMLADVPLGPAGVRLGAMLEELRAQGHYREAPPDVDGSGWPEGEGGPESPGSLVVGAG